jgi:hypothetical protein
MPNLAEQRAKIKLMTSFRLSLILAADIRLNHSDKPCDANTRQKANDKSHRLLTLWFAWVSRWAQSSDTLEQPTSPIIYRQINVLKLSYSQALIYLSRPAIMDNILTTMKDVSGEEGIYQGRLKRCMGAARTIALVILAMDKDPLEEGKHPVGHLTTWIGSDYG